MGWHSWLAMFIDVMCVCILCVSVYIYEFTFSSVPRENDKYMYVRKVIVMFKVNTMYKCCLTRGNLQYNNGHCFIILK